MRQHCLLACIQTLKRRCLDWLRRLWKGLIQGLNRTERREG